MTNHLADLHLTLRRDSVYLESEDGILFRTRHESFELKGKGVYSTFQRLVPHLDGSISCQTILNAVPEKSRAAVHSLLDVLVQRSVVRSEDLDDRALIPSAVAERFRENIDFIAHVADKPGARFLRFRDAKIAITGSGIGLLSAALALLRNGLRTLRISNASHEELQQLRAECAALAAQNVPSELIVHDDPASVQKMSDLDLVLYCSDRPVLRHLQALTMTSPGTRAFLPAIAYHGKTYVGPLTEPERSGCWLCAMLRWAENAGHQASGAFWRRLALDDIAIPGDPECSDVSVQMLGNTVAMEAFRFFTGAPEPESRAYLLQQDVNTLEASRKALLPHVDCPRCRRLLATSSGTGNDEAVSHEDSLRRWSPFVNDAFGVFKGFSDESLEQVPLRVSLLERCGDDGASGDRQQPFLGVSISDSNESRVNALMRACSARVSYSDTASSESLLTSDTCSLPLIEANKISGWLEGSAGGMSSTPFIAAVDMHTGNHCLLPACAVQPSLDGGPQFDSGHAGIGAGLSSNEARERAVLSLFEQHTIASLVQQRLTLHRWTPNGGLSDRTTECLISLARTFGIDTLTLGLVSLYQGVFTAMVMNEPSSIHKLEDLIFATERSPVRAINAALVEAIGREQVVRQGYTFAPSVRPGFFSGAHVIAQFSSEVDAASLGSEATQAKVLANLFDEGSQVLCIDCTPRDIAQLQCVWVAKAFMVART